MQQSQRAEWTHALEYAVERANALGLPVAVVFGLMADYPEATECHYAFMLQGFEEVFQALEQRGIGAFIGRGHPADIALKEGREALLIVCDMGLPAPSGLMARPRRRRSRLRSCRSGERCRCAG